MRDNITLRCRKCGYIHDYTVKFIEGVVKGMKQAKYHEVAKQMHEKRGPFYDKWLAAMEKRGEQMRCSDCLSHHVGHHSYPDNYCFYKLKVVHPAWFACKHISYYQG